MRKQISFILCIGLSSKTTNQIEPVFWKLMNFKAEDFANIRRDSTRENALFKELRSRGEDEALRFILRLIELDPRFGLVASKKVLRTTGSAKAILQLGIKLADASSMKWWLQACIPKLGVKRVTQIFRGCLQTDIDAVDYALYWIPYRRQLTPRESALYWELKELYENLKKSKDES